MKIIYESLKTMVFMLSSVMVLLVSGCGGRQADPIEFKSKVIEGIQNGISSDMPLEIIDVEITPDESKSTKTKRFGNFVAVAIATENLYERVPPGTDLKKLMPGYLTEDEINNAKSNFAARLEGIRNSANDLPKKSAQYFAVMDRINAARLLLANIRGFEPYSFATIGVVKGEEITVNGTITAILSNAKEWAPVEIEIIAMKLNGIELTERKLFVESKRKESELIIEKSGANWVEKSNAIAMRKKIVSDTEKAVDDALAALRELSDKAPEAEIAKETEKVELKNDPIGSIVLVDLPTIVKLPKTQSQWYDESGISALIRTNANVARQQLLQARSAEPENPKHHYWSALAFYEMGGGIKNYYTYSDARKSMLKAVQLEPNYKNDKRVTETPCVICKWGKFGACKIANCDNGKIKGQTVTCPVCNNTIRKKECKACDGTGKMQQICFSCDGTGKTKCAECNGTGKFFWKALELQ